MDDSSHSNYEKNKKVRRNKEGEKFLAFLHENIDFAHHGFSMSYKNFQRSSPYMVFDSEWCRVSFTLEMNRPYERDHLMVSYGRIHAPDEESVMEWKGKSCWCWHRFVNTVFFIEGLTPEETIVLKSHNEYPNALQEYLDSDLASQYHKEYRPKYYLHLHKTIWEHYGQRFFEVFDVRQINIWEQFKYFVKEYYRIKGMTSSSIPGLPRSDEIC